MKKIDERGGSDWVSMDDMIGMEVGESDNGEGFWKAVDDVDDLEKKGYWSGKFKVGDKVNWIEPDKGYPSDGWTIEDVTPGKHPSGDDLYIISRGKSSVMNIHGSELRPIKMMKEGGESEPLPPGEFLDKILEDAEDTDDMFEVYDGTLMGDGSVCLNVIVNKDDTDNEEVKAEFGDWGEQYGWKYESFSFSSDLVGDEGTETINVYFRPMKQKMDEATVVVDANDVWDVLDLLDDETANKNLTDLINSHVRSEEEIMDAIDSCYPDGVRKGELNAYMNDSFYEIVDELGLDVEKFKQDGQFVDPKKPVALESDGENQDGDTKFKIGDYVSGPGLRGMVVKVYPRPSGERQRYLVKCMHGRDKGLSANMFEDELTFRHSGDGDENTRSATLVSYGIFDVDNLMKFLKGLKPKRGEIKYEIVDVKAESDETVKVTFQTRGSNKDIHSIIAKDYIAYDIENWKVSDISEPVEDKEHPGMFKTEVTLKMEYDMRGKRASSMELESDTEDKTSDELKDGDKKYKQDGETKTLVTGSDKENNTNDKQEVTEMTIEQEIDNPWKLSELLWGQGRENLRELLESELFDDEFVMQMIEGMEIHDLTAINDAFAYDFETILDMFGCDPHAWSQNLEIKKKGDEGSED